MKQFIFILLIAFLAACGSNENNNTQETSVRPVNLAFDLLLEDYFKEGLKLDPLRATEKGIEGYNHGFPNYLSCKYREELKAYYSEYLKQINEHDDEDLTKDQVTSKKVAVWDCEQNLERLTFRQDLLPIDQTWSINHLIGEWANGKGAQPFNTVSDYNNWLLRLDGYLEWMDTAKVKMEEGIRKGYVLPKALIIKIPATLEPFMSENPSVNPFYGPLKIFPESFSDKEKEDLRQSYTDMITNRIIPSYSALYQFITTTYLEAGRESAGIDGIPNGESYYKFLLRSQTSTDLTAEEIYQFGLEEVARIRQEMEMVKSSVGFTGDLKAFFSYIRESDLTTPYTEPKEVIGHFEEIYASIKPNIDAMFDLQPEIGFEIRRTEPFLESTTGPHYCLGSVDGTRPGIFYVSIPNVREYNNMYDETTFLHEAIPGHHFQIAITQQNESLPAFRRFLWVTAYGEGWALYTESLGKELGLYTDPYQYFGNLSYELHRAIRLVVDVGIHALGWTREKAIQYSMDNEPYDEQFIANEIERYMAFPGQALGYKIGQRKISELRIKAEKELGQDFDIKSFHSAILETGCIPLSILEDIIDSWIATK